MTLPICETRSQWNARDVALAPSASLFTLLSLQLQFALLLLQQMCPIVSQMRRPSHAAKTHTQSHTNQDSLAHTHTYTHTWHTLSYSQHRRHLHIFCRLTIKFNCNLIRHAEWNDYIYNIYILYICVSLYACIALIYCVLFCSHSPYPLPYPMSLFALCKVDQLQQQQMSSITLHSPLFAWPGSVCVCLCVSVLVCISVYVCSSVRGLCCHLMFSYIAASNIVLSSVSADALWRLFYYFQISAEFSLSIFLLTTPSLSPPWYLSPFPLCWHSLLSFGAL